jgi:glycosyltransferase involved in cell wall biosynthesis
MKKKVLLITTDVYPYGHSELLYSENIDLIAKEFDIVEIFSLANKGELSFNLPKNVHAQKLDIDYKRKDYIIEVFFFFIKTFFKEKVFLKINKCPFTFSHFKVFINSIFQAIHFSKQIEQRLKKYFFNDDLIYAQSYWCNEVFLAILILKIKTKKVQKATSYLHGYDLVWERYSPKYLPLRWFVSKYANKLFFVSEFGKNYFSSKFTEIKPDLIVNYLGVSRIFEIKKKDIDFYRIVSCSRIIPLKRIHLIIESLELINQLQIEWIHFGSGEIENEIKDLAFKKLGLKDNITYHFMGSVENHFIQKYYSLNQVDLFCNVSEYEGIPISIMEAMAYGIPCLATDVGGVNEIVNNHNGILIQKDCTIYQLKNHIEQFILKTYEEKQNFINEAILTWERKFNSKSNFLQFLKIYKEN